MNYENTISPFHSFYSSSSASAADTHTQRIQPQSCRQSNQWARKIRNYFIRILSTSNNETQRRQIEKWGNGRTKTKLLWPHFYVHLLFHRFRMGLWSWWWIMVNGHLYKLKKQKSDECEDAGTHGTAISEPIFYYLRPVVNDAHTQRSGGSWTWRCGEYGRKGRLFSSTILPSIARHISIISLVRLPRVQIHVSVYRWTHIDWCDVWCEEDEDEHGNRIQIYTKRCWQTSNRNSTFTHASEKIVTFLVVAIVYRFEYIVFVCIQHAFNVHAEESHPKKKKS